MYVMALLCIDSLSIPFILPYWHWSTEIRGLNRKNNNSSSLSNYLGTWRGWVTDRLCTYAHILWLDCNTAGASNSSRNLKRVATCNQQSWRLGLPGRVSTRYRPIGRQPHIFIPIRRNIMHSSAVQPLIILSFIHLLKMSRGAERILCESGWMGGWNS
jgi:hypothetical protein